MNFDSIQPVRDYEINFFFFFLFFSFNRSEFYRLHVEVEDQTIVIKTIVVKKFDSSSFFFFFSFLSKIRKQRNVVKFQNRRNIIYRRNAPEGSYPLNCSRLIV